MGNGKSNNATGAGATNPVKKISYLLPPSLFLYFLQKLNKNQTSNPTTIQAQNLITNMTQNEFIEHFRFLCTPQNVHAHQV